MVDQIFLSLDGWGGSTGIGCKVQKVDWYIYGGFLWVGISSLFGMFH